MTDLEKYAEIVDEAARTANAIPQFTDSNPEFSVEDAYKVQALSVARRVERGERRIGIKMGLTSRAKMVQVGVDEVIWGRLTDAMLLEEGATLSFAKYVHPRLEPEIAFLMGADLSGPVTAMQAMAAVEAVAPAMELIDSRYQNFKFALPDVVADNSSSSGLVIGNWCGPGHDISNLGMIVEVDGRNVEIGSSAAILGDPVRSLVAAARMTAEDDGGLKAGDIVMAGGATAAHSLSVGETVRTIVEDLGSVTITVGE